MPFPFFTLSSIMDRIYLGIFTYKLVFPFVFHFSDLLPSGLFHFLPTLCTWSRLPYLLTHFPPPGWPSQSQILPILPSSKFHFKLHICPEEFLRSSLNHKAQHIKRRQHKLLTMEFWGTFPFSLLF